MMKRWGGGILGVLLGGHLLVLYSYTQKDNIGIEDRVTR